MNCNGKMRTCLYLLLNACYYKKSPLMFFLHSWPQCIHPHELVQPTIYKELLLNTFKAIWHIGWIHTALLSRQGKSISIILYWEYKYLNLNCCCISEGFGWDYFEDFGPFTTFNWYSTNENKAFKVALELYIVMLDLISSCLSSHIVRVQPQ